MPDQRRTAERQVNDMFNNIKEGTIKFQDCEMDYAVFGKGTDPLVIVQGLNLTRLKGAARLQSMRYKLYADNFRVYMVDRREPLPDIITVEEIADDVANGLSALGVSRAYVMGNSQGGMIAQYLALNHPKLVKKLVLNVTTSGPEPLIEENVNRWAEMAAEGRLDDISKDMTEKFYSPNPAPEVSKTMASLYAKQLRRSDKDFKMLTESCLSVDTYDRLKEIKCPVRVMAGKQDAIISSSSSVKIAEALGTEAYLFDGLGHAAYETKEYQKKVLEFLLD